MLILIFYICDDSTPQPNQLIKDNVEREREKFKTSSHLPFSWTTYCINLSAGLLCTKHEKKKQCPRIRKAPASYSVRIRTIQPEVYRGLTQSFHTNPYSSFYTRRSSSYTLTYWPFAVTSPSHSALLTFYR